MKKSFLLIGKNIDKLNAEIRELEKQNWEAVSINSAASETKDTWCVVVTVLMQKIVAQPTNLSVHKDGEK